MLLITGARLGDLIGRRRMFLLGVGGFTLASLACGLAPDIGVLIAARFVQGAGAAAMMPQIMTVIQLRFSRARAGPGAERLHRGAVLGFVAGQVIGGAAGDRGPVRRSGGRCSWSTCRSGSRCCCCCPG